MRKIVGLVQFILIWAIFGYLDIVRHVVFKLPVYLTVGGITLPIFVTLFYLESE